MMMQIGATIGQQAEDLWNRAKAMSFGDWFMFLYIGFLVAVPFVVVAILVLGMVFGFDTGWMQNIFDEPCTQSENACS